MLRFGWLAYVYLLTGDRDTRGGAGPLHPPEISE